jgi:2'-phosphotransferase
MADDSFDDVVEIAELSLPNRGERSGRGRGRGGRSTGGRPSQGREVEISKALSKLLRHAAVEAGLELDGEGFAKVDQVVGPVSFLADIQLKGCRLCGKPRPYFAAAG